MLAQRPRGGHALAVVRAAQHLVRDEAFPVEVGPSVADQHLAALDHHVPVDGARIVDRTGTAPAQRFHLQRLDAIGEFDEALREYQEGRRLAGTVAGPSFGVGSSREHAVWAIQQGGFDAVIAPSFSDIFRNNCTKNGLVPVVVPESVVTAIWAAIDADHTVEIVVDMERLTIEVPAAGKEAADRVQEGVEAEQHQRAAVEGDDRERTPGVVQLERFSVA